MNRQLAWTYTLLAIVIMSIYGVMVCPFIDSLPNTAIVAIVTIGFGCQAGIAAVLQSLYVEKQPCQARPRAQFKADLSSYLVTGFGLGLFNYFYFDFPLESGLKLVIGAAAIGFFAATDNALFRERSELPQRIAEEQADSQDQALFPITLKLSLFIGIVALVTLTVLILVLYKDTMYLLEQDMSQSSAVMRAIFVDTAFVMLTVLALGFRVFYSFSKNLKQLFHYQIDTMAAIEQGDLEVRAPLVTRDELRLIARGTNRMIAGLKEKERIKDRFGKAVSPQIAERLLAQRENLSDSAQYNQVVILFCDIRGFTSLSEALPADEVVPILNRYFTAMVSIIERNRGVVDKFIGDAILAVFGLDSDDQESNARQAIRASLEIASASRKLNWPNGQAVENGIGIHLGRVVSGILGAPGRHEFTVVGDVVNTASRIEKLCKTTGQAILISEAVHTTLPDELQALFADQGEHSLRGKQAPMRLFGRPAGGRPTEGRPDNSHLNTGRLTTG